ncbi:cell envelope integrity protein TolA [Inhella crocodyli]|uniref:Cell envelope integrity protein TolA n=2 Tax=Inhella crocodyli TaxID=2499851 RepID=A0A437LU91_9BURK|nr:cell envelope integrity protein TolA [Inhella crocodyli]
MQTLPWRPQHDPGLGRGIGLALGAHALLLVALKFGLDWRTTNHEPAFEAELWSAVPQAAAPRAVEPPPPPPEPEVQTRPAPTPVEDPSAAQRDADIRLERERERKEREKERLRLEKERQEKLKADKAKADKLKAEKQRAEEAKLAKDKAEKDRLDKQRQAQRDQQLAEAKREQLRQEQLRRIQGMAGASGGAQATGTALQSSGPSASYAGRVMARVRPNIRPPKDFPRELVTDVLVRLGPDGTIFSATVRRGSGNAEWDEWAVRAVLATAKLPLDTDGTVPKEMVIGIRPNE